MMTSERKVLCIYTGGTIGMLPSASGLRNTPGFLYRFLRSADSRFHDPHSNSVFANAHSIERFASWSEESSRAASPVPNAQQNYFDSHKEEMCNVVCPTRGAIQLPTLVLPKARNHGAIRYAILEYEKLIDSSDVSLDDWVKMATTVEDNYKTFDSFVILHGTDTMSYSSSALSFLLENLGKTVIVTGAQIPLSEVRNDAIENLLGALMLAGTFTIPEVTLYFNHRLLRGNRTTKQATTDFNAFYSPNLPPLVEVGIAVDVDWSIILRPVANRPFVAHKSLSTDVATLRLFPGISAATVASFLAPPIKGVVLETYGAGNAPQRPDMLEEFRKASEERGVVILNVTQCMKGAVAGAIYEAGRSLQKAGVIGGYDMTTEAALCKLAYLLAKPELTVAQIRQLLAVPIRGELTLPSTILHFEPPRNQAEDRVNTLLGQIMSTFTNGQAEISLQTQAEASLGVFANTVDITKLEEIMYPIMLTQAACKSSDELANQLIQLLGPSQHTNDTLLLSGSPPAPNSLNRKSSGLGLLNTGSAPMFQTPLHAAVISGNLANVDLLLSYGASVHCKDVLGQTALDYATRLGFDPIAETLRASGAHSS